MAGATKRCGHCRVVKSASEFHRNAAFVDGLNRICKQCRAEWGNERRSDGWVAKSRTHRSLVIRSLRPDEDDPEGEPRRYVSSGGYVRLRWKVGVKEYVERYERDDSGSLVRTIRSRAKRVDWEEAARLYESGLSQPQVARIMKCNAGALSRALSERGVVIRSTTDYFPSFDDDDVVESYRHGATPEEIAQGLGVGSVRIRRVLRDRGVMRRPGNPQRNRPPIDEDEVRDRYLRGSTPKEVARAMKASPGRVRQILKESGIMRKVGRRSGEFHNVVSDEALFRRMRKVVIARSGGECEAHLDGCTGMGQHVHHRMLQSQGGPHTMENLRYVCWRCHITIHANPEESYRSGLLLHSWQSPDESEELE